MNSVSLTASTAAASFAAPEARVKNNFTPKPPEERGDTAQVSPAARQLAQLGRIALNQASGTITGDEAAGLYSQLTAIHAEIAADRQANGGKLSEEDAAAVRQMQNELGQSIAAASHDGTEPPAADGGGGAALPMARIAMQTGRVVAQAKAGNISNEQAKQLMGQISDIATQMKSDAAANGGKLTADDLSAIAEAQDALSKQIYGTAHPAKPVTDLSA